MASRATVKIGRSVDELQGHSTIPTEWDHRAVPTQPIITPKDYARQCQRELSQGDAVGLWWHYVPAYREISRNKSARRALRNHPGTKFMRRGYAVLFAILTFIALIGAYSIH